MIYVFTRIWFGVVLFIEIRGLKVGDGVEDYVFNYGYMEFEFWLEWFFWDEIVGMG